MTTISTNDNTLALTIKDENFPLMIQTEALVDLQKKTKVYVLEKTKSGCICITEKK